MADSRLEFQLSSRLKSQFEDACNESETSMSVELRKMIANFVRNHTRQSGKVDETLPVTASVRADKPGKGKAKPARKMAQ